MGILVLLGVSSCGSRPDAAPHAGAEVPWLSVPGGFRITWFAPEVPGARSLARGDRGTVFVGTRGEGRVYALVDADSDGAADAVHVVDDGLTEPNGVAFGDGALFVAERSRILRYDGIESRLADPPDPVVVRDDFPRDAHHGWKFIAFGPDGFLYVPVGAPCNVCTREDPRYASITRMAPDGSTVEVFASGVRNTVGFDWHPDTGELWFTDNGRDHLGDDVPPDELDRAPVAGLHFGFPYCHGEGIGDPEYGAGRDCDAFVPPVFAFGAHTASLGMRFERGSGFGPPWAGSVFVAQHGSWNRSTKVGYRVVAVHLEDGEPVGSSVFAEGWLVGERTRGRPVDVLFLPDGALLVSDDHAGAVYRISRPE